MLPPRTLTAKSIERRADIARKAATLFDAKGYHQATMEDIAAEVGLRKSTLYHHVASKEEILFLIHEEFVDLLMALQAEPDRTSFSPEHRLLATMTDLIRLMSTHRAHVRVFFEHHRELPAPYRDRIAEKRDAYFALVSQSIEDAVYAGVFEVPDVHLAALAVFGMCNWAYTWYRPDGRQSPDDIAGFFWDWLTNGMRPRSQRRRGAATPKSPAGGHSGHSGHSDHAGNAVPRSRADNDQPSEGPSRDADQSGSRLRRRP